MPSRQLSAQLAQAKQGLGSKALPAPRIALVLGSGLGAFAQTLQDARRVPYGDIEGMPLPRVEGHAGSLVFGSHAGSAVVAMQGRAHLYEGHSPQEVVFGVRLMITLGARVVLLTNAAGGISTHLQPGSLMLLTDHLNLTGRNPLAGPNDDTLGPRFPDMSAVYDPELRELAQGVARGIQVPLQQGVYAGLLGPSYETPAEIRMLRSMGADAVGMSTVLEAIAARHMGARCLGISCVTNQAAGLSDTELSHAEVQERAQQAQGDFVRLLQGILEGLPGA